MAKRHVGFFVMNIGSTDAAVCDLYEHLIGAGGFGDFGFDDAGFGAVEGRDIDHSSGGQGGEDRERVVEWKGRCERSLIVR